MFVQLEKRVVDTNRIISVYRGTTSYVILYERGSVVVPFSVEYYISDKDYDNLSDVLTSLQS